MYGLNGLLMINNVVEYDLKLWYCEAICFTLLELEVSRPKEQHCLQSTTVALCRIL